MREEGRWSLGDVSKLSDHYMPVPVPRDIYRGGDSVGLISSTLSFIKKLTNKNIITIDYCNSLNRVFYVTTTWCFWR